MGLGFFAMALLESTGNRIERGPHVLRGTSAPPKQQSAWRRMVLQLVGNFLVLMGFAGGVLALCFALVLVHGVMH